MVGLTIVGTCFVLVGALISSKNGVLPPVTNFSKFRLLYIGFKKSIGVMLVIGLPLLPPLPLCALVLLIVLLTGNIKILLVLVAFGPGAPLSVISIMSFGSVLPVPTSPPRVLLPPFLLASAGLLGKTHKLSNRSVFGSLSSSPSFGRFNMVNPCLSLLSGSPYLVPVVGCLAISMVTPFCVLHLSH